MVQPPRRRPTITRRTSTLQQPAAAAPLLVAQPSERSRASRDRLLEALVRQGASTAPVQTNLEGIARALTAGVGGLAQSADAAVDRKRRTERSQRLAEALTGGVGGEGAVGGKGIQTGALAQALLDNPALEGVASEAFARQQFPDLFVEQLSPRDKAFAALSPEEQARALGATPKPISPRDQAFALLSAEEQARALGAAPPVQSAKDQAFANLTPEQQAIALGAAPGPSTAGAARETQITDTMQTFGIDRQEAVGLVDGFKKTALNPDTGEITIVDIRTGQGERVDVPAIQLPGQAGAAPVQGTPVAQAQPPAQPATESTAQPGELPQRKTIFESIDETFGAGNVAQRALSNTVGQLTEEAQFPEESTAGTRFADFERQIVSAFALSARPPIFEQERIARMLPSTGVFQSKGDAEAKLTDLHAGLTIQLADDLQFAQTPGVPAKQKQEAIARARGIQRVLRTLGNPPTTGSNERNPATPETDEEFGALPPGSFYIDPDDGQLYRKN